MDHRLEFLKNIETELIYLEPEERDKAMRKITKLLSDYEIVPRCTDIVPIDSTNERLLKRYTACLRIDGRSEKTIYRYRRQLIRFMDAINKPFTEVGVYDIRYYIACEKDRGIANSSLNGTRSVLSAFYTWLMNEEVIQKNPMATVKTIKTIDEIRHPFTDIQIDALRSACTKQKERALIEVLLASGVRVDELSKMEVADIDFSTLTVKVKHGKGGKERITYITPVCAMHLKKYLLSRNEQGPMLFYNGKHEQLKPGGIRFILNDLAARADVSNVHPHRFRRTFASRLAERGMDIQEIQKLLGHSKLDTTTKYVYTSDEQVKSSYRKYA